jgi:hypothetical protein
MRMSPLPLASVRAGGERRGEEVTPDGGGAVERGSFCKPKVNSPVVNAGTLDDAKDPEVKDGKCDIGAVA